MVVLLLLLRVCRAMSLRSCLIT